MVRFVGLMARETSAGGVTVRVVDPETPPTAAVIVVVPAAPMWRAPGNRLHC